MEAGPGWLLFALVHMCWYVLFGIGRYYHVQQAVWCLKFCPVSVLRAVPSRQNVKAQGCNHRFRNHVVFHIE